MITLKHNGQGTILRWEVAKPFLRSMRRLLATAPVYQAAFANPASRAGGTLNVLVVPVADDLRRGIGIVPKAASQNASQILTLLQVASDEGFLHKSEAEAGLREISARTDLANPILEPQASMAPLTVESA
jgi:hypothetical protein